MITQMHQLGGGRYQFGWGRYQLGGGGQYGRMASGAAAGGPGPARSSWWSAHRSTTVIVAVVAVVAVLIVALTVTQGGAASAGNNGPAGRSRWRGPIAALDFLDQPSGHVTVSGLDSALRVTATSADISATGLRSPSLDATITSAHLSASFAGPTRQIGLTLKSAQATTGCRERPAASSASRSPGAHQARHPQSAS